MEKEDSRNEKEKEEEEKQEEKNEKDEDQTQTPGKKEKEIFLNTCNLLSEQRTGSVSSLRNGMQSSFIIQGVTCEMNFFILKLKWRDICLLLK